MCSFSSIVKLHFKYLSTIKCEIIILYIYYIIAHSDISMKLHSFGQQNIQIQEISRESLETYPTKKFK